MGYWLSPLRTYAEVLHLVEDMDGTGCRLRVAGIKTRQQSIERP
jgi:hypothetical protein